MAEPAEPLDPTPADPPTDPAPSDPPSDPAPADPPAWGDNWREQMTGGDEAAMKMASRFTDPQALWSSYQAAQARIRSGELAPTLSENPSDQELSDWREAHGIPAEATGENGYKLEFDSGLVIGEDDQPLVDGYLEAAHKANQTPAQVKQTLEWYYAERDREIEAIQEADRNHSQETEDILRNEWGADYRQNKGLIDQMLQVFPEEVRNEMVGARTADQRGLFNNADFLKGLAQLARERADTVALTPGGEDVLKSVEDRIGEIEKVMRTSRAEYNRDEKMQAEYRDLLDRRDRINAKK